MDEARRSVDGIERGGSELNRLRLANAALVAALKVLIPHASMTASPAQISAGRAALALAAES